MISSIQFKFNMWQLSNTLFLESHVLTKVAGYYCQKRETMTLYVPRFLYSFFSSCRWPAQKQGTKKTEHGLTKYRLSYLIMRRKALTRSFFQLLVFIFLPRSNQDLFFLSPFLVFRLLKMLLFTQEIQI